MHLKHALKRALCLLPRGRHAPSLSPQPAMKRFYHPDGIDLVDCGDIRLFMLTNDNLYSICVEEERKHFPLEQHYSSISRVGYARAPVDRDKLRRETSARYVLYKVVDHFLRNVPRFRFIDLGAFVGDVSLRYANYCRTIHTNRMVDEIRSQI